MLINLIKPNFNPSSNLKSNYHFGQRLCEIDPGSPRASGLQAGGNASLEQRRLMWVGAKGFVSG